MSEPNIFAGITVNILVPILGIVLFLFLYRRMSAEVPSPPFIPYLILFSTFGGWLMVFLTALFWVWSGMASLGVFYLAFLAPFVTAGTAFALHTRRTASLFHRSAYIACISYSVVMVALTGAWVWWSIEKA